MKDQRIPRHVYNAQIRQAIGWVRTRHWGPSQALVVRVLNAAEYLEYDIMDRLCALEAENAVLKAELGLYQKEKEALLTQARQRLQRISEDVGPAILKQVVASL